MSLLALLNPAKACLALASVFAGYCLLRFYAYTAGNLLVVPYLLIAGALLAMADSAWRQVFAAAAQDMPDDTAPSGTISTTRGYFIAVFLTLGGLMCSMTGGYSSFRVAGCMVVVMLARSALFRRWEVLSPLLGGLCHGLLFVIGMTAHPAVMEMLSIQEVWLPTLFYIVYMIVASVLAQARDSSRPREKPVENLTSRTATRLLDMRGDAIDRPVAVMAGVVLALLPLALSWIMPWRWLSWTFHIFLSLTIISRLIPVAVYRTRRDLTLMVETVYRGAAFMCAGIVACFGVYQMQELYGGWSLPLPGRDELAAVAIIAGMTIPAWLFRRAAPME